MLRTAPVRAASPAIASPLLLRPRVAPHLPVVQRPPDRTIAVRGHMPNGSAAAVILEDYAICIVSADRARRRHARRFTLREVLSVEEQRSPRGTELTIVTSTAAISVLDVDIAQAWTFCREVRELILRGAGR